MPGEEVSGEVVERCIALVRQLADAPLHGQLLHDADAEARAIVALLPEPVDPDLVEARRIVFDASYDSPTTSRVMAGYRDDDPQVVAALAGIRRGRQLAQEQS